ncbi:MAG TPA: [FeFe] hydrogenase H-cluster radical SAM maturase HydE [Myxococcota bacterium]|nr:[FeFe] hydrogenase H-cluster radical SAM maturase HydE [Myxococcota bacterium]HQK52164.1 [FeFe] hydrogenase H-cluster radical SAM maturase HydE [Myxococcota bacterium]
MDWTGATDVLRWLRESDPAKVRSLLEEADAVRRREVGDEVHLRGLVEVSNRCVRDCAYCGIAVSHRDLVRYRMTAEEVLACARMAARLGFGTVVLQGGEDYGLTREWVAGVVRAIRQETPLAITLSLGERPDEDLIAWREAGADRYLLRFETTDQDLYRQIHPPLPGETRDRFQILARLRELDYEVGSGIMVGIPGQTWETLARDLWRFREMDLDMIGIGPFIPHPETPLGRPGVPDAGPDQVPANEDTVLRCVALARLLRPDANIPSTTALATINRERGREHGLQCGANVVMPNLTPQRYRVLYEIYPAKASADEPPERTAEAVTRRVLALGRTIARGPGPRRGRGR